jgi:hypothetical protein
MIKYTLDLPDNLWAAIDTIAQREGRSRSSVVREAISIYLAEQPDGPPASRGIFEDDSVTPDNVRDRTRENWQPE